MALVIIDKSFVDLFIHSFNDRVSDQTLHLFILVSGSIFALEIPFFVSMQKAKKKLTKKLKVSGYFELAFFTAIGVQCFALVTLIAIAIQISDTSSYWRFSLSGVIFISYGSGIVFLAFLSLKLARWFGVSRQVVLLVLAIGLGFFIVGIILEVIHTTLQLDIMPEHIGPSRSPLGFLSSKFGELGVISNLISGLAFIIIWIATALLLRPYAKKYGIIRHYFLISIPLVYFAGQFETLYFDMFYEIRVSDPFLFDTYYTIVNATAGAAGGILFGLSFWVLTRKIVSIDIKAFMTITSVGFMLLFSLTELNSVRIAPYPPFGLISSAAFGLATYMVFFGLFLSAASISVDSEIRRDLRRYAESSMLESIGFSELEEKLNHKIKEIGKALDRIPPGDSIIQPSDDDLKNYVKEVIEEVKNRKDVD